MQIAKPELGETYLFICRKSMFFQLVEYTDFARPKKQTEDAQPREYFNLFRAASRLPNTEQPEIKPRRQIKYLPNYYRFEVK